jgi:hypothetical protein
MPSEHRIEHDRKSGDRFPSRESPDAFFAEIMLNKNLELDHNLPDLVAL